MQVSTKSIATIALLAIAVLAERTAGNAEEVSIIFFDASPSDRLMIDIRNFTLLCGLIGERNMELDPDLCRIRDMTAEIFHKRAKSSMEKDAIKEMEVILGLLKRKDVYQDLSELRESGLLGGIYAGIFALRRGDVELALKYWETFLKEHQGDIGARLNVNLLRYACGKGSFKAVTRDMERMSIVTFRKETWGDDFAELLMNALKDTTITGLDSYLADKEKQGDLSAARLKYIMEDHHILISSIGQERERKIPDMDDKSPQANLLREYLRQTHEEMLVRKLALFRLFFHLNCESLM